MVLEEQMGVSGGDGGSGGGGGGGEDEEPEYESDPEDAALPLTMRRREASDDEEEGDGEEEEEEEVREKVSRIDPRVVIDSDVESDGQGGAPGYDDEESEIEEEELEEVEEDEYEHRGSEREYNEADEVEVPAVRLESGGDGQRSGDDEAGDLEGKDQAEGEKKENEPFAVPTAGAFYMHDDRFRENGGGRNRRTPGGRKLWESRDDKKWGHDKFEELNSQETQYDKERKRGPYRGRGKRRGVDRGYARVSRPKSYDDNNNQIHTTTTTTTKTVRGRGPRRYEPLARNSTEATPQNKFSGKSRETPSNNSSGRAPAHAHNSNVQSDAAPPRKNVFASSLNSASPPFYPSGSSNQDISATQKRDVQVGTTNRNPSSVLVEGKFPISSSMNRGKNAADPVGQGRHYMDESIHPVVGKLSSMHLQSSGFSPINTTQSQSKAKGRGLDMAGQLSYQPAFSPNQVNRGSQQTQLPSVHQKPVSQPLRASTQQVGQHPGGGSQASSPPKGSSTNSSEPGETDSPPGSSKSKMALVGKGKGSIQGSGRGSFLYNGAHVIGAAGSMGVAPGDQNFPGTPALLPVMQFGSQHPGVPAVGMALPGYVAQPQLGFGNSEMAWVPVIAGGAGAAAALGAPYCSPYVAVDGGYYTRASGQTSSSGSSGSSGVSRETTTITNTNTTKSNSAWNPPQRSELVNDEFGQRQNKPRRYSEMNFGQ